MFPANWRLPLFWAEIDPSRAGLSQVQLPALLIGYKFASGIATPDVPIPVGRTEDAQNFFGLGSMLERMVAAFYNNNVAQELWCLPLTEPASGTAATGNIVVATPPSQAGTISLYVAGQVVEIGVSSTDTVAIVATNIAAAINAVKTMPVTAVATTGTVALTCRWKDATGNDIDVRDSYYGRIGGESLPIGLTLTYPTNNKLSGGSGFPTLTNGIANMGDDLYEYVAFPWTDSNSLLALQAEYGFTSGGRWGWMRQLYGQIYSARRDTYTNLITWGVIQNAPQTSVMAFEVNSPSPVWEWTTAYCAQAAMGFSNDPALPLQTLPLLGIKPAPNHFRFVLTETNLLASNGLAVQQTGKDGTVRILREATNYQLNVYGVPDTAYTDMTTLATLARLLRDLKQRITSRFPRCKLVDDGTLVGPGQLVVSPKIIKAELVAYYAFEEFNGLCEDADAFASTLIVERDSINPNRVNVLFPPFLPGQLRIFAVLAQFRLLSTQQVTLPPVAAA
jgi:phage tail sheath gpL-like